MVPACENPSRQGQGGETSTARGPPMNRAEPPQPGTGLASSTVPPGPISWPAGVTAAACLTFDMDAEAAVLTADISSIARMSPMSHQSYPPLVGVPPLLPPLHPPRATP